MSNDTKRSITVLGVGRMGSALAGALLERGYLAMSSRS